MINEMMKYKEPLEIRKKMSEDAAEMTEEQLSILCGLIKEYKPNKIVEIGVAAGGTTAVILNCLSLIGIDSEIYSIDISENFYRDKSKKTGYWGEEAKNLLNANVNHKLYIGTAIEHLDTIGEDIDFLILDTVHTLPGELFDFLACLPKMKMGGAVVLHDTILNHLGGLPDSFATRVLYSSVVGKKITYKGDNNIYDYPGMGIFEVTDDTWKYIENIFFSLTITWNYMPEAKYLDAYKIWLSKYYSTELMEEFEKAIEMNRATLSKKRNKLCRAFRQLCEIIFNFLRIN